MIVLTLTAIAAFITITLLIAMIEDMKGNNIFNQKHKLYYTNSEYMMAKTLGDRNETPQRICERTAYER